MLLVDSALVNAKDEFGYTPLHVATDRERREAVQYLVSKGADKTILVSSPGANARPAILTLPGSRRTDRP